MHLCEVIQHSVAAPVGEDNLARAVPVGAVTDLHDVEATVLEVVPNSEGMGDTSGLHICATDLQVTPNSEGMGDTSGLHICANDLHAATNSEGMGNAAVGDIDSVAFSDS